MLDRNRLWLRPAPLLVSVETRGQKEKRTRSVVKIKYFELKGMLIPFTSTLTGVGSSSWSSRQSLIWLSRKSLKITYTHISFL